MKGLKKVVSGLVATVIAISSLVTSVGAEGDTAKAEIEFSLKYLDSLPKKGQANFDEFLKLPDINKLKENREDPVKHKDGSIENVKINEKNTYDQIKTTVEALIRKANNNVPKSGITEDEIEDGIEAGKISKYYKLPRDWRIANEIYRWVASNIKYDDESIQQDESGKESFWKPQDAFFVYQKRMGVCEGKANLLNLMMRMAGIPSATIGTLDNKSEEGHAYNAVYLEENNNPDRIGWTLLDSTNTDSMGVECTFPAFYNAKIGLVEANRIMISKSTYKIESILTNEIIDGDGDQYYFEIDGIDYELCGKEGNSFIEVTGYEEDQADWIRIPSDIVNLGLKFKIGCDIKLLVLKGDEVVDLSEAEQLESVDITNSNKYITENGVLYEKNMYGAKGKKLKLPENKQVKVIGEKALVIDKVNLEKLENAKYIFLQDFEKYSDLLKFSVHKEELPVMKNDILETYNGIKGNPTQENLVEFEEEIKCFREIMEEFKKNDEKRKKQQERK